MAYPFPAGVSGFVDPGDELAIETLESCAAERRKRGLPSYTREELERLFEVKDAPAPPPLPELLPPNVISLATRRRGIARCSEE